MKALTVDVKYSPKELAEICRKHGAGSSQFSFACCPFPGASCPIGSQKTCSETTAEDWEKALQDEEPEPEFHFGDKVSWKTEPMVFIRYEKIGRTMTAVVVSKTCQCLFERCPAELKAGWE